MSIAYSRDDKHSIVVNEAGYRSTPSVLALSDQEFLVGVPAKQNLIRNSRNSILFAKHFINATSDAIIQRLDCQVNINSLHLLKEHSITMRSYLGQRRQ